MSFKKGNKVRVIDTRGGQDQKGRLGQVGTVESEDLSGHEVRFDDGKTVFFAASRLEPAQPADAVGTANEAGEFVVGDKVRILETASTGPQVQYRGQVGTIIDVDSSDYQIEFDDGERLYFAKSRKFERVDDSCELDSLIAKANEALATLALLKKHGSEVENYFTSDNTSVNLKDHDLFHIMSDCLSSGYLLGNIKLRRKQKPRPQFAAFTTSNGWDVGLCCDNDLIDIGCQTFDRKRLTQALRNLIDNNEDGTHVDGLDLGATRKGVEYVSDTTYILPWPDAEALYEALKKYQEASRG